MDGFYPKLTANILIKLKFNQLTAVEGLFFINESFQMTQINMSFFAIVSIANFD